MRFDDDGNDDALDESEPKWGTANKRRGTQAWTELAIQFLKDWPIGSRVTIDQFDEWAEQHDLLVVPRLGGAPVEKSSDAWLAHLQRRHRVRYSMNKAAAHPRMHMERNTQPFSLDLIGEKTLKVRSALQSIAHSQIGDKVQRVLTRRRQQLGYLMQSVDWNAIPVYEKMFASTLYDDIDKFERTITGDADWLTNKFNQLRHRLDLLIKNGSVLPRNGGLKAITAGDDDSDETPEES